MRLRSVHNTLKNNWTRSVRTVEERVSTGCLRHLERFWQGTVMHLVWYRVRAGVFTRLVRGGRQ